MSTPSPLDDPDTAAFAFARWKRIMGIVAAITAIVVGAVLVALWRIEPAASIHYFIAVGLGIGLSMLLAGALMGLMFLSNGTGHDESVIDPLSDED